MTAPARSPRLQGAPSAFFTAFNASTTFDHRLAPYDLALSRAHATMLARQGILPQDEVDTILRGLDQVEHHINQPDFVWDPALEDVHMNLEKLLTDKVGVLGRKLHTGRSRNDQVATAFRMYVRAEIDRISQRIATLQDRLCQRASEHADTVMPGFTHLQAAQPVTFGHHLLAWNAMFQRDRERLADCRRRLNAHCPLGAAALAGTPHAIDPAYTAQALGFDAPLRNSLDAVSDRDFVLETAFALSTFMVHLSRQAEEVILWMSPGWQLLELPPELCSGSSIMPQKRNPDLAELVRGKSGRVLGALHGLLVMMKGQPLAYNKDNQEDKEPLMDALATADSCAQAWCALVDGMQPQVARMRAVAGKGHATATDLADLMVSKGMPFRDAYHRVGALVTVAEQHGVELPALATLPAAAQRLRDLDIAPEHLRDLSPEAAVRARAHTGGTAPEQVRAEAQRARRSAR